MEPPRTRRLALVVERFEPRGGGVEAVAWATATGLAEAGDEVHVFARRLHPAAGPAAREAPRARLHLHELRVPAAWQPARVLAFSAAAARFARRNAFDVVQSFARTRHQDVYRAGGGSHADYMERAYRGLGRRARRLSPRHAAILAIERRVFADPSQLVLCNSEMVRHELRRRYGIAEERLAVIPNGVDLERFRPERRSGREARELRAVQGPGGPVWLLAGSGFARKGLDTALRALAASGPGAAALWVAGRDDPADGRALAERLGVGPRVRFLGPREDMEHVYAAADALLLPTRYDSFANVCLEAAASGLPIVTSGANGAAGWLGGDALVVEDPEDVSGFAKCLDALADAGTRARLGAAARRRAETRSWGHHVRELRGLHARVARQARVARPGR